MSKLKKNANSAIDCWKTIGVWSHVKDKCEKLHEYTHCRNCPVFSEIGRSVFEKTSPSGYLKQWRKEISEESKSDISKPNSVLIFRVGCEWFALQADMLSEVANEREIHRIPRNLNSFISGIVNINGEIKVCYSLSELLTLGGNSENLSRETVHNPRRLVVVEFDDLQYVFLADEVLGLHWYSDEDVLPLPATLSEENSLLLLGVVNQFNHQIAIFNIKKLQERLEGVSS